jgi:hypothetical protein
MVLSKSGTIRVFALVFAVLLLATTPAAASQLTPNPPSKPIDATLYGTSEQNPWGCTVNAQNPHLSGHYPGTVAAVAVHGCAGYWGGSRQIPTWPQYSTLEAWLYHQSCFLFVCWWSESDHLYSGRVYPSQWVIFSLTTAANCTNSNNTQWRLYAVGTSYGYNGSSWQTYSASAFNIQTLTCGA